MHYALSRASGGGGAGMGPPARENATIAARGSFVKQDGSTVPVNESSQ